MTANNKKIGLHIYRLQYFDQNDTMYLNEILG